MGFLEASDYDFVDIELPFTVSITVEFCVLFKTAGARKSFTEYVDDVSCMYKTF